MTICEQYYDNSMTGVNIKWRSIFLITINCILQIALIALTIYIISGLKYDNFCVICQIMQYVSGLTSFCSFIFTLIYMLLVILACFKKTIVSNYRKFTMIGYLIFLPYICLLLMFAGFPKECLKDETFYQNFLTLEFTSIGVYLVQLIFVLCIYLSRIEINNIDETFYQINNV